MAGGLRFIASIGRACERLMGDFVCPNIAVSPVAGRRRLATVQLRLQRDTCCCSSPIHACVRHCPQLPPYCGRDSSAPCPCRARPQTHWSRRIWPAVVLTTRLAPSFFAARRLLPTESKLRSRMHHTSDHVPGGATCIGRQSTTQQRAHAPHSPANTHTHRSFASG